jgi:6-phosphofructokinase 1
VQPVVERIERRNRVGAKYSIIIAAEGATFQGGEAVYQEHREVGAQRRLGGIGAKLAQEIRKLTDTEVRVTVLGHLQRGGSPTAFDRLLASRYGSRAVHLVAEGKLGQMVALQAGQIVDIPIEYAAAQQKLIPLSSDVVQTALDLDICLGNSVDFIHELSAEQEVARCRAD